jgi:hypothetical protein
VAPPGGYGLRLLMPILREQVARRVEIELGEFGRELLWAEAERQEVSVEQLAAHAVMYYLADLDSGRIARGVPGSRNRKVEHTRRERGRKP